MIRSEVINLAKQADVCDPSPYSMPWEHQIQALERFAALVAAAEREACARLCESEWSTEDERRAGQMFAREIRARNEPPKNGG